MGMARELSTTRTTKKHLLTFFVSQGYNTATKKLEITTTANQDPLLARQYLVPPSH